MLGEAMPDVFPELHFEATKLHKYGSSWINSRGAWLAAAGISMTNTLAFRPPNGNKLEDLCGTKTEVGKLYPFPALTKGKYLREQYFGELDRLARELEVLQPNLVLALGNTASWALLRATNISSIRGTVINGRVESADARSTFKTLPTYHPAGVLRNWAWRPIVVADIMKAVREAEFPEIRRPKRKVLINPTIEEAEYWTDQILALRPLILSPDIETHGGQISCIGFAWSSTESMVIPFLDKTKKGWSYWETQALEERAWNCVARLLESSIPKVGQNFLYDLQYICKMGIRPAALDEDTMLLHHSLYPELQKGLGFLGSIYTNEASWKLMRKAKADSEKRDE